MNKINYIIFDLDNTLINYEASAQLTIRKMMRNRNLDNSNIQKAETVFRDVCSRLWESTDLDKPHLPRVHQHYHDIVRAFNVHRFDVFKQEMKHQTLNSVHSQELSDDFDKIFKNTVVYEKNVEELLQSLSSRYSMSCATNGLAFLQNARIKALMPYFEHIFISEQMNVIKPLQEYFMYIVNKLDKKAEQCLFVGDTFETDIIGALNAGMNACWYNPSNKEIPLKYADTKDNPRLSIIEDLISLEEHLQT